MNLTVVDYGLGNVHSILSALSLLNYNVTRDINGNQIKKGDLLIIPGVASFGSGIENLRQLNQFEKIVKFFDSGKSIIGVCLGAQMLLKQSQESPDIKGLGLVDGCNLKLNPNLIKTPNQGWSRVIFENNSYLYNKFNKKFFYFSHSYKMNLKDKSTIIAKIQNINKEHITAVFEYENLTGLQFHPEKSGSNGLEFLSEIIENKSRV